jgi:hypothetical protein
MKRESLRDGRTDACMPDFFIASISSAVSVWTSSFLSSMSSLVALVSSVIRSFTNNFQPPLMGPYQTPLTASVARPSTTDPLGSHMRARKADR